MRKAGAQDYKSYSKQILKVCPKKPISFEVFADDQKSMIDQGKKINTWGKNVYVKVPVVNSKNKFMGDVIKELNNQNIEGIIVGKAIYDGDIKLDELAKELDA